MTQTVRFFVRLFFSKLRKCFKKCFILARSNSLRKIASRFSARYRKSLKAKKRRAHVRNVFSLSSKLDESKYFKCCYNSAIL